DEGEPDRRLVRDTARGHGVLEESLRGGRPSVSHRVEECSCWDEEKRITLVRERSQYLAQHPVVAGLCQDLRVRSLLMAAVVESLVGVSLDQDGLRRRLDETVETAERIIRGSVN